MNKWQKMNKTILLLTLFSLKFNIISTYFVYFNNIITDSNDIAVRSTTNNLIFISRAVA